MKRKIAMTTGLLVAGLSACFAQGWQKPQLQTTELTAGQDEIQTAIASVTVKLLEDDLAGASRENPIDVTDKFITNTRYENNDNEGWKGNVQPGIDANNNLQNAEFFNTNFDTWQDLQGLPEGTYRLSLQGFYRAGLEGPAYEAKQSGNETLNAELYVTTNNKTTTKKMQSIFTGAPTSKLGVDGEINLGQWWVPNTMSAAAVYFAKDYYKDNSIEVQVTNGQLRIGLRKSTTIRRDWVILDKHFSSTSNHSPPSQGGARGRVCPCAPRHGRAAVGFWQ